MNLHKMVHPVVPLLMRLERAWVDHDTAWARAQILALELALNGHLVNAHVGPGGTVFIGADDVPEPVPGQAREPAADLALPP